MKRILAVLMLAALLCGCGAQETFETVDDLIPVQPVVSPQQFSVSLPAEAAAPTFRDDSGSELYVCSHYTIGKQILPGGDLEKTVKTLTGKEPEDLQIIRTQQDNQDRYDFVWTAAGENGLQLGRACILDDGNYHYTLTTMAGEEYAGQLRETFRDLFDSCRVFTPEQAVSIAP